MPINGRRFQYTIHGQYSDELMDGAPMLAAVPNKFRPPPDHFRKQMEVTVSPTAHTPRSPGAGYFHTFAADPRYFDPEWPAAESKVRLGQSLSAETRA
jgi:hypothetical protein